MILALDPQQQSRRQLDADFDLYREVVPRVVKAAPHAVLLVATDPPEPLADLTRQLAGHDRVLSTGTLIYSLRGIYLQEPQ